MLNSLTCYKNSVIIIEKITFLGNEKMAYCGTFVKQQLLKTKSTLSNFFFVNPNTIFACHKENQWLSCQACASATNTITTKSIQLSLVMLYCHFNGYVWKLKIVFFCTLIGPPLKINNFYTVQFPYISRAFSQCYTIISGNSSVSCN